MSARMARLLIVGAGGHGHVLADTAAASGRWSHIAFLDDRHPQLPSCADWPVVGGTDSLQARASEYPECLIALGDARLRLEFLRRAQAAGMACPVLIHPRSCVSSRARLGAGTVVIAGAVINIGAVLGEGCIVNTAATVDHDCVLEEGVHVCPGAHLAGSVHVGARTWFGIGAVALQGIRIGADVMVGAGAACTRDIAAGSKVGGVPAGELSR